MTALVALALLAAAESGAGANVALDIDSDSSCPSAGAVRSAIGALGIPDPPRPTKVMVRDVADGFRLEFIWEGQDERAATDARTLLAPRDCVARAQTAAVVVATWLGALPSNLVPAAVGSTTPAVIAPAPASTPPPDQTRGWWLGAGLGAAAGGGVVPGARLELARVGSDGYGLGWLVSVQATLPRSRFIGEGTSRWLRPAVGLAGTAAWRLGRVGLAADLGPLASLTIAWGADYPSNRSDQTLVLGFAAGLRLLIGPGPSRPWVEVRVIDWLGTQRLRFDAMDGSTVTTTLPALEGLVTLGWNLPL